MACCSWCLEGRVQGANVQQVIPEAAGGYAQDREQDERWDLLRRRHGVQARSAAKIHLCQGHRREATLLHFVVQEMTLSSAAEATDIAEARRRAHQCQEDGDRGPGRAYHLGVRPVARPVPNQGADWE